MLGIIYTRAVSPGVHEATFTLTNHDDGGVTDGTAGSYDTITAQRDARISLWCNDHRDLLAVETGREGQLEPVLEAIDQFAGIDDALCQEQSAVVVTERCVKSLETTVVDDILDGHGCLLLSPIRYHDSGRSIRVLALEADHLTRVFHELRGSFDVTVETKRKLSFAGFDREPSPGSIGRGFDLSARQQQVLTTAVELGYYEVPRATSMHDVAARVGIDRRTADEHRRQAERKVLEALVGRDGWG